MAKEKTYSRNYVEGFNPYDYIKVLKDRLGQDVLKSDGTPLKYLPTKAKINWFNTVCPEGSILTDMIDLPAEEYGKDKRCIVEVWTNPDASRPKVRLSHDGTSWDRAENGTDAKRLRTVAIGLALSEAGFGDEIELALDMLSEGISDEDGVISTEVPKETVEKKKRGRPKKEAEETESVEEDVASMLSAIEEASKPEEPAPEPVDDEEMKKALATKLECTDSAPLNIRKFEGKTLEEIMAEHENFCTLVKTRPNIKKAVSEEVLKAATYIADHK